MKPKAHTLRRFPKGAAAVELTIGIAVILVPLFTGSFVLVNAAHMKEWLQNATNDSVRQCALDPAVNNAAGCVQQIVRNRILREGYDGRCALAVQGNIANRGDPADPVQILSATVTCQYSAPGWPARFGAIALNATSAMPRLN